MKITCPLNRKITKAELRRLARLMVNGAQTVEAELRGPAKIHVQRRQSLFRECLVELDRFAEYVRETNPATFQVSASWIRGSGFLALEPSSWNLDDDENRPADWPKEATIYPEPRVPQWF